MADRDYRRECKGDYDQAGVSSLTGRWLLNAAICTHHKSPQAFFHIGDYVTLSMFAIFLSFRAGNVPV